jgi:hypothetical protein
MGLVIIDCIPPELYIMELAIIDFTMQIIYHGISYYRLNTMQIIYHGARDYRLCLPRELYIMGLVITDCIPPE